MTHVLIDALKVGDLILVHPNPYGEGFVCEVTEKHVIVNYLHYFVEGNPPYKTEKQIITYWRDELRTVDLLTVREEIPQIKGKKK